MKSLFEALGYALSLPERTIRSVAGAVGGVSKIMTDTLLPRSLRGTSFYKYFLGNTQKFLIEGLGGVETATPGAEKLPENYLPRAILGSVADGAGAFAFHFSPLWFFAIVGDVAGGTKDYLRKVVEELKKDGALTEEEARIDSAEELLEALSKASSKSTQPFDTPPLSASQLKELKDEIAGGYRELWAKGRKAIPSPDSLWASVQELRKQDKVEFLRLMGTMTLASAKAAGKASGAMLYEKTVLSYRDSLEEVRKEGFGAFFRRETAPYVEALSGAFSRSKKSWTEKLLSGDWFRK